jgi:SAM-dependent methyltransferase
MRYLAAMRDASYGQKSKLSMLDIVGQHLSSRRIVRLSKNLDRYGRLLDLGCGFNASLTKPIWKLFDSIYLADVEVDINLENLGNKSIQIIKGELPDSLKTTHLSDVDLIVANNILEHLVDPARLLKALHACRSEKSIIYVNVPSWRGKFFLELAAFKFGLAPRAEMEDHKFYFDKKSLWILVRGSGFKPSEISIKNTKFGLNVSCWIKSEEL